MTMVSMAAIDRERLERVIRVALTTDDEEGDVVSCIARSILQSEWLAVQRSTAVIHAVRDAGGTLRVRQWTQLRQTLEEEK
jgi:hypothetical protein